MENLLKKEIDSILCENNELTEKMEENINNYVEFIENNVPKEYREFFGVGIAGSHPQFGDHYGFLASGHYEDYYACCGNGYYIANDFNCYVNGSNLHQMKEFLENIPEWVKNGKKEMKEFNSTLKEMLGV